MSHIQQADNSTPEGAILLLESAYNSKDINAVFNLIDFAGEAEIMLNKILPEVGNDFEMITETATALKLSLEKNLIENEWPQFDNSNIIFEKEIISTDLFIVSKILLEVKEKIIIDRLYVKKQRDNTYKVAGLVQE